ncbi:MAG: glycosyltransferase family 2 protein [Bacteroidota bacterium]
MVFSVIICTRNRCKILHHCLQSFVEFGDLEEEYEVLLIDNGSTDSTKDVFNQFRLKIANLRYVHESQVGLSHARNRGALASQSQWLLYIDDDAKLIESTLSEYHKMINEYDFKLFTGIFRPWYLTKPPVWMKDRMVSYIVKGPLGIRAIGDDYISGGVMGLEKKLLMDLGMFNIALGMKGEEIGYGEESELQRKAALQDYSIGFNSNLIIDHLVGEHKYQLSWFINSAYAKGSDAYRIDPFMKKFRWSNLIGSMLERALKNFLKSGYKLVFEKKYALSNWYLDNIGPMAGYFGIIRTKWSYNANQNKEE